MEQTYDVIIAGCGAAGLYGALNLPETCRILLLCKQELTLCNTALAQGGIAGVYNSPEDSTELHHRDTMIAGGFKNNPNAVQILVESAAHEIQTILDFGVDFDRKPDGTLHRTLEGGHSMHRIFHHKDTTGAEILATLGEEKFTLQRSKGLGENEADMMALTTMNPATRRLIQVTADGIEETAAMFDMLLGDDLQGRKDFIAQYGSNYLELADIS